MLKKILVTLFGLAVVAQGSRYCQEMHIRCIAHSKDADDDLLCGLRYSACMGSDIWVAMCPPTNTPIANKLQGTANVPPYDDKACVNEFFICDELAVTPDEQVDCNVRMNACKFSTKK